MARLRLTSARNVDILPKHVGKVLLFCEGDTEKNYFDYFQEVFQSENLKYAEIVIETIHGNGNAQSVLNRAEEFFSKDENVKKYQDYRKFLVFDCDAPDDVQNVICTALNSPKEYYLLLSNLLFETWLIMHFQEVDQKLKKKKTYETMADFYGILKYGTQEKADKGLLRRLINDGSPVYQALENADRLEKRWLSQGKDIKKDISDMNPYTQMHVLVKEIMDELQYSKSTRN